MPLLLCMKITRVDPSFHLWMCITYYRQPNTKYHTCYIYGFFWHFNVKYLCFERKTKFKTRKKKWCSVINRCVLLKSWAPATIRILKINTYTIYNNTQDFLLIILLAHVHTFNCKKKENWKKIDIRWKKTESEGINQSKQILSKWFHWKINIPLSFLYSWHLG